VRAGTTGAYWSLGLCIALFAAVAVDVTQHGLIARVDPHIAHWSFTHVTAARHDICMAVTHLGDAWLLGIFTLLAGAWLTRAGRRYDALLVLLSAGATAVLTAGLKEAFRRDRPVYVDAAHGPKSFSFPSGHSSGAYAVYLLLAIVLTAGLGRRTRAWAVSAALGLATVVAASRVLLPIHFLSDVIAGGAIGLGVVASALLARTASGHRH